MKCINKCNDVIEEYKDVIDPMILDQDPDSNELAGAALAEDDDDEIYADEADTSDCELTLSDEER